MKKIIKDNFISKLLNLNCYLISDFDLKSSLNKITTLNKPYFLTIKSRNKLSKNIINKFNLDFICKQITYEKKFFKKDNFITNVDCRLVEKKDFQQLKIISLEKSWNSRFVQDRKIDSKIKYSIRLEWLKNFFRKKRGDYLIVAHNNNILLGYLILSKIKKKWIIDIIATKEKAQKKGVGSSLINYAFKTLKKINIKKITAGTQSNNTNAISFYEKNGFSIIQSKYIYHVHSD